MGLYAKSSMFRFVCLNQEIIVLVFRAILKVMILRKKSGKIRNYSMMG